jgi:thiamine biosynthesis lipoprotein
MPQTLLATHAMGTRFELVIPGGSSDPAARAAGEEALAEIELWHARLSRFEPGSTVALINREAHTAPVRLDPETFGLIEQCERLRLDTGGAFDITVGGAMEALGFHPPSPGTGPQAPDLGPQTPLLLDRSARTITLPPGTRLDLGAIAKSFALDRAAEILRGHDVASALIHGGTSSVVAIGSPPGEDGWPISVRSDGEPMNITLRDAALGVSAPRGRTIVAGDGGAAQLTHILDPRTGLPPVDGEIDTAAVTGPSAALCDAWSTALIVRGRSPLPPAFPGQYSGSIHSARAGWLRLTH